MRPDAQVFRLAVIAALAAGCPRPVPAESRRSALISPEWSEQAIAPPILGHAWYDHYPVGGTFDGTQFVLVNDGFEGLSLMRIDTQGRPTDPVPLALAGTERASSAAYAWDGTHHVLAWRDRVTGGLCFGHWASDGTAKGDGGACTGIALPLSTTLSAASAGGTTLLAWSERSMPIANDVLAIRVRVSEQVDATPLVLTQGDAGRRTPAVASDGTDWVVAWYQYAPPGSSPHELTATRVSAGGAVLDRGTGPHFAVDAGTLYPALTWAGGAYHLVYGVRSAGGGEVLVGQRLTQGLVVIDTTPFEVVNNGTAGGVSSPLMTTDGTQLWVAFQDYRRNGSFGGDVYSARVDLDGGTFGLAGAEVSRDGSERWRGPIVAAPAARLAFWADARWGVNVGYEVFGAVLDTTGRPTSSRLYSTGVAARTEPAASSWGDGFAVAWVDQRNGGDDIYLARVDSDGRVLDDGGVRLGPGGDLAYGLDLASFDGGAVAVWSSSAPSGTLLMRAVGAGGVAVGAGPVQLDPPPYTSGASVAGAGELGLVVWSAGPSSAALDIRARRVLPDGTFIDATPISVCVATGQQLAPSVRWDGQNFLVSWLDRRVAGSQALYAARVALDGTVREPNGVEVVAPITTLRDAAMAPVPGGSATAWAINLPDSGTELRVRWFDAQLSPKDAGIDVYVPDGGMGRLVDLVHDGADLLLSMSGRLIPLRGGGVLPSGASSPRSSARAAFNLDGRGLLTWEDSARPTPDVRFAMLGQAPNGTGCGAGADCRSGWCAASGHCCPGACAGDCSSGACVLPDGGGSSSDSGTTLPDGGSTLPDGGSAEPERVLRVACGCAAGPGPLALCAWAVRRAARRRTGVGSSRSA